MGQDPYSNDFAVGSEGQQEAKKCGCFTGGGDYVILCIHYSQLVATNPSLMMLLPS